jgi:hypothetical protein
MVTVQSLKSRLSIRKNTPRSQKSIIKLSQPYVKKFDNRKIKIVKSIRRESFNLQNISRLAVVLLSSLWLVQSTEIIVRSQSDPGIAIDRVFRYESSSSGFVIPYRESLGNLKKWMGAYQRIIKEGNNYLAIFDRGSLPVLVDLKENGDVKGFTFGCPISKSLSITDAPEDLKKALTGCTNRKP